MSADLDAIFRPRSIAVVGASRRPVSIGHQILDNLVRGGFTGAVYPVNPHAAVVHSIKAYPSVTAVPAPARKSAARGHAARIMCRQSLQNCSS